MAPVLNSQPYQWNFGTGLDTSLRVYNGDAYILAMTDGGTGVRTFTLPPGVSGAQVEVVDEGRTLTVTNGTFTDTFSAEHTHHIYRISLR
jgi:microcystin-dependent protein